MVPLYLLLLSRTLFLPIHCGQPIIIPTNVHGLSVQATVLECFSSGPFVVEVEIANRTQDDIFMDLQLALTASAGDPVSFAANKYLSKVGSYPPHMSTIVIGRYALTEKGVHERKVNPASGVDVPKNLVSSNSVVKRRFYLHRHFAIAQHLTAVEVTLSGKKDRKAIPSEQLTSGRRIFVVPAEFTVEARRRSADQLMHFLDSDQTPAIAEGVAHWILGCSCQEYIPVALRLLQTRRLYSVDLIDHIYLSAGTSAKAFEIISGELSTRSSQGARQCFEFWRSASNFQSRLLALNESCRTSLVEPSIPADDPLSKARWEARLSQRKADVSELDEYKSADRARGGIDPCPTHSQISTLLDSPVALVSALAAIYYPETVGENVLKSLVHRLSDEDAKPTEEQWATLVRMLQSGSYRTRASGFAAILDYGDRVLDRLDKLSKTSGDAEVSTLAATLLATIRNNPFAKDGTELLIACANKRSAVSERILAEFAIWSKSPALKSQADEIARRWSKRK